MNASTSISPESNESKIYKYEGVGEGVFLKTCASSCWPLEFRIYDIYVSVFGRYLG